MTDTYDGPALATERDRLALQVTALETTVGRQRSQMRRIAEMLLEEADNRDFCGEYDEFVDRVNDRCGEEILLHRTREWTVTFQGTMAIEATTAEQARSECEEQFGKLEGACDWSVGMSTGDVELSG